jgi:hypothetical protein
VIRPVGYQPRIPAGRSGRASLRSGQLIARRSATGGDLLFDADNPVLVRVGLWSIINTTVGVLNAHHLVAEWYGCIRSELRQ